MGVESRVGRRTLLKMGATSAFAVTAGTLSGCGNDGGPESGSQAPAQLPNYVPYTNVKPDYPATEDGGMPGFRSYPKPPARMLADTPGAGEQLVGFGIPKGQLPTPFAQNQFWHGLNERLGVDLQFILTPAASYQAKVATLLAGNDLPDVVQMAPNTVPRLPDLLHAKFQDLSEYLSGAAVENYPALANIPQYAWQNTVFNGRIYGLPEDNGRLGMVMISRGDLREEAQATRLPADGDEFVEMCRSLTNPKKHRWAIGSGVGLRTHLQEMLGGPNIWRQTDGKFISEYETDEMKQAIRITKDMWAEGLLHPDSYGTPGGIKWLLSGAVALFYSSYGSWTSYVAVNGPNHPDHRLAGILPAPYEEGREAAKFLGRGVNSIGFVKKASKERIELILRVANWLAAPFGTEESLYRSFGPEGRNFTWEEDGPALTSTGVAERSVPTYGIVGAPQALYVSGHPETTKEVYEYQKAALAIGEPEATVELSSNSADEKGPRLTSRMKDLESEIIQGRRPLSDWDSGVRDWRKDGGDSMRAEYEQAFADLQ